MRSYSRTEKVKAIETVLQKLLSIEGRLDDLTMYFSGPEKTILNHQYFAVKKVVKGLERAINAAEDDL